MNMTRDPHPKFDPNKHHRKSIRLQGFDYSQAGAYFVTMVVQGRECLFGEIVDGEMNLNEYGEIVQKWWNEIPIHFLNVELGAFVIMPNHVHGIIWIIDNRRGEVLSPRYSPRYNPNNNIQNVDLDSTNNKGGETPPLRKRTLGQIVAYFKYQSTKEMNHIETKNAITKFWQRNYYEHIIRSEREMDTIWRYIEANPAQWDDDQEKSLRSATNKRRQTLNTTSLKVSRLSGTFPNPYFPITNPLLQLLQHLLINAWRSGEDGLRRRDVIRTAICRGDARACFFCDQSGGGNVPGFEGQLPEGVEAT
jgi:REP element-mobilizing transposase RayT